MQFPKLTQEERKDPAASYQLKAHQLKHGIQNEKLFYTQGRTMSPSSMLAVRVWEQPLEVPLGTGGEGIGGWGGLGGEAPASLDFPPDHCLLLGGNHAQRKWKGVGA